MKLRFVAIARTTFDIPLAAELATLARGSITDHEVVGSADLLVEAPSQPVPEDDADAIVLLMATFADSTLPAAVVGDAEVPIVLWGVPEPRTGDRLRLNALCGINLAAYELRRRGHDVRWLYAHPADDGVGEALDAALAWPPAARPGPTVEADTEAGIRLADRLAGLTVGLVGDPPAGFTPCLADHAVLAAAGSPTVDRVDLDVLFERASSLDPAAARGLVDDLVGIEDREPGAVDAALQLHLGLAALVEDRGWDGVATRCWPECFTEFGAAACAAQGLLADTGVPATCEADVPGTLTALVLREAAGAPPMVADLVDVADDGTMAFWHCGLAPESMAGEVPAAADHPNRGLPLLRQFRFRPGRVTVARFSASLGVARLVIGGGEVLDRPRPYHGTSGVVRMDRPGDEVLATVMAEGLDHHYGIVYGDVRAALAGLAEVLGIDVVWL
ncbi:MAG: hypothetical protein AB1Z55_08485 [Acidimicrobiia bacterium]